MCKHYHSLPLLTGNRDLISNGRLEEVGKTSSVWRSSHLFTIHHGSSILIQKCLQQQRLCVFSLKVSYNTDQ